ncbi:MAG: 3-deoxy-D-manno-octulosonic acid transferase [Ferruginibacter sp.]|nr:3-deoxy-D-manno-octulosonic acid transferase [Ferruginibacter sp.]
MSLLFYNLFLFLFSAGIRVAALWNRKANLWVRGRMHFPLLPLNEKVIWMHCASLGEFEQGRPVLEAIREQYPSYKIVLSFFSPSGYETRKNFPGADSVIYLPMDSSMHAKRLITAINPSLVIWVKYEYWYYYLTELKKRNIPVLLISGIFRESQPFFRWYGGIWKQMLKCFRHLFVQNEASKVLLRTIEIEASVAGDTRFDRVIAISEKSEPVEFIRGFIDGKPVLVAGSTWEDDEVELIHYVKAHPEIKFIIAPHETDRNNIEDVKKEFANSILYSSLFAGVKTAADGNVLLIDNIGMLSRLYQYADVTYVGGGFGRDGIHNILEAAVYSKPVIFGPVYEKFAEARYLVESGGAFSVESALELEALLNDLFKNHDECKLAGKICGDYVYNNKGATKKIMDYVTEKRLLTS